MSRSPWVYCGLFGVVVVFYEPVSLGTLLCLSGVTVGLCF